MADMNWQMAFILQYLDRHAENRTYFAFPIIGSGLPFLNFADSIWVFDLFGHKSAILRQIYLENKFGIWFFISHSRNDNEICLGRTLHWSHFFI
jgi:hypothetical protein